MRHYDVIIIGAGAAGLMCAAEAAKRGRRVLLLEHSKKPGKKILMSGGGRCNFTNLYVEPDNFISGNPHFCKSALHQYTQWDFIALVERYAIPYHERDHGQLFCDRSAKDILQMLLSECTQAGAQIHTGCELLSVAFEDGFKLATSEGGLLADSLVIATGGLSIPTMGSTGIGHQIAQQFGMGLVPIRAGLVPLTFSDRFKSLCERLAGIAVWARLSCGETTFTENILFTHRGLSGPAVLQLSNYWQPGDALSVNLLPEDEVEELFLSLKQQQPKSLLRTYLSQRLPKKLVLELQALIWPQWADTALAQIPGRQLRSIAWQLQGWQLKPSGSEGYRTAEVTLGGVDTTDLSSKTMESRIQPGLYFIGEVVDVTGHLGGFNFQWAWSSGFCAGQVV